MTGFIIFGICTLNAIRRVNPANKWYRNADITLDAYIPYALYHLLIWITLTGVIILFILSGGDLLELQLAMKEVNNNPLVSKGIGWLFFIDVLFLFLFTVRKMMMEVLK